MFCSRLSSALSFSRSITWNASAKDLNAAETSPGTGTACSLVRCSAVSGVISESRLKNEERSGRREASVERALSVACSAVGLLVAFF